MPDGDLVAAGTLGCVEGLVGSSQQFVDMLADDLAAATKPESLKVTFSKKAHGMTFTATAKRPLSDD